jgi:hypothetical protein
MIMDWRVPVIMTPSRHKLKNQARAILSDSWTSLGVLTIYVDPLVC